MDRLVRKPTSGLMTAARPGLKAAYGCRLRCKFAGSQLIFPGPGQRFVSNRAFNARIKLARQRAAPVISAHRLRHLAVTLLLK